MKKREISVYRIFNMVFLFFLSSAICLQAEIVKSQNIRITLNKNNVRLENILNEIESQTNLLFIYNKNVNVNREVSIEAKNTILDEVLKKLFDKDVIYKIEGSYIVLSPSSQTEMKQQAEMIKGTVADQKGNPIIGANIVEKGNPANGTITDVNGNYSLAVSGNAVLVASYIGYNKIEIPVNDRSVVDIVLTEDMQVLEEVVVVGHSTQKKSI